MAKEGSDASINLDSFLDIMTCLVGVLVLILILTGIDAGQIRVLIPTPMAHSTDKRPVYLECRNDQIFLIPVEELRAATTQALNDIADQAGADTVEMLRLLSQTPVEDDQYRVDLSYALLGQFALAPLLGSEGYPLENAQTERAGDWFGRILTGLDAETEMLSFLVRDDSYGVFKRARHLAWKWEVEVSYDLLDVQEVIKFGLGGSVPLAQ